MKIAVFTDSFRPQVNGVTVFLQDSLELLSREHDVVLFAPGDGTVEDSPAGYKIRWMPSSPFPLYEGYLMSRATPISVNSLLKEEKPDIVHLHAPILLGISGLIAAKKRKLPVVATYHTHFPDYLPHLLKGNLFSLLGGIGTMTTHKLIKLVYGQADAVTAPTLELCSELESYGIDNVIHLPNGLRLDKLKGGNSPGFRKKHGIGNRKLVVYAGRMSVEKKVGILLEAFSKIDENDAFLLLVGSGPGLENLKKKAGDLSIDNCSFTGFVDDSFLGMAYSAADVFVSASDTETFGLTFIEAMSFGTPVIGVDRLGSGEIITDGKDGLLAEPGDVADLSLKIWKLVNDDSLREKLSENAKKTAKKYSMDRCISKTIDIYENLLEK
jgi:glycosyltransferase involved in cell wall biosynthesis